MPFDPNAYGPGVAAILSERSDKCRWSAAARARPVRGPGFEEATCPSPRAPDSPARRILGRGARDRPSDRGPPTAATGMPSCTARSPTLETPRYWFRQVGQHPIFPALAQRANGDRARAQAPWDPDRIRRLLRESRRPARQRAERRALEIQQIEWELLFDYCCQLSQPRMNSSRQAFVHSPRFLSVFIRVHPWPDDLFRIRVHLRSIRGQFFTDQLRLIRVHSCSFVAQILCVSSVAR